MVLTYDNDGYGIANMDAVVAHEVGHIFRALDEYREAGIDCHTVTGYLNIQNSNSLFPSAGACGMNQACIMRGQISPFASHAICPATQQQLGWRDSDGNGLFDPVDTTVTVSADLAGSVGGLLRYTGWASDNPWPANSPVSINWITDVEYRLDGLGDWLKATPTDGAWNGPSESFSFSVGPLNDGPHTITVQALNSVGNFALYTRADDVVANAAYGPVFLPSIRKGATSP
jgi:hypothetical protein